MCQLSKMPSTDIQKFLSRIRSKSVSSSVLNMIKFGMGEQFSNAALLTYHSISSFVTAIYNRVWEVTFCRAKFNLKHDA
jgi:hypothetical protein